MNNDQGRGVWLSRCILARWQHGVSQASITMGPSACAVPGWEEQGHMMRFKLRCHPTRMGECVCSILGERAQWKRPCQHKAESSLSGCSTEKVTMRELMLAWQTAHNIAPAGGRCLFKGSCQISLIYLPANDKAPDCSAGAVITCLIYCIESTGHVRSCSA